MSQSAYCTFFRCSSDLSLKRVSPATGSLPRFGRPSVRGLPGRRASNISISARINPIGDPQPMNVKRLQEGRPANFSCSCTKFHGMLKILLMLDVVSGSTSGHVLSFCRILTFAIRTCPLPSESILVSFAYFKEMSVFKNDQEKLFIFIKYCNS